MERGASTLPPVEDGFVRISVVDLGEDRVVKLSDGTFSYKIQDAGDPEEIFSLTTKCIFSFLHQEVHFVPSFENMEMAGGNVITVNLCVYTLHVNDDEEAGEVEEEDRVEQEFASVMDVWKLLDFCMTV